MSLISMDRFDSKDDVPVGLIAGLARLTVGSIAAGSGANDGFGSSSGFNIPNVLPSDLIFFTPGTEMHDNFTVAEGALGGAGNVLFRFRNNGGGAQSPGTFNLNFLILRG